MLRVVLWLFMGWLHWGFQGAGRGSHTGWPHCERVCCWRVGVGGVEGAYDKICCVLCVHSYPSCSSATTAAVCPSGQCNLSLNGIGEGPGITFGSVHNNVDRWSCISQHALLVLRQFLLNKGWECVCVCMSGRRKRRLFMQGCVAVCVSMEGRCTAGQLLAHIA